MSENNGHARTSGILSIVAGIIGILMGLFFVAAGVLAFLVFNGTFGHIPYDPAMESFPWLFLAMYGTIGLIIVGLSILAIVGGNYSVKRQRWGLALAGAISGSIVFYVIGIIAVIYVCLSKAEFDVFKPEIIVPDSPQEIVSPPIAPQI